MTADQFAIAATSVIITGLILGGLWHRDRSRLESELAASTEARRALAEENYANAVTIEAAQSALANAEQAHRDQETLLVVAAGEIDRLTLGQPLGRVLPMRGRA